MNRFKELRTRLGMRQKDIAEKLGTTQQTVARWETGQAAIPVAQLKDLAILFGCRIDDLLDVEVDERLRKRGEFARAEHGTPWGTFSVRFAFGERLYPVDETQRRRLSEKLHSANGFGGEERWLAFDALDNRRVYLNLSHVTTAWLLTDDLEEMPYFVSPEAYRSLTVETPLEQLGPVLAKEREEIVSMLGGELSGDAALDEAIAAVTSLKVIDAQGQVEHFRLSDTTATSIFVLELNVPDIPDNAFLTVSGSEGECDLRFSNLDTVAAIEAPLEECHRLFADA